MKKIIITTIILIVISLFFVPPYNELNNLAIIDNVGVEFNNGIYNVYFREIIPIKDENGIGYKYKIYKDSTDNLNNALKQLQNKTKKKLYLKKVKSLITNTNSDKIKSILNIKPKTIYHTTDIENKMK